MFEPSEPFINNCLNCVSKFNLADLNLTMAECIYWSNTNHVSV